MNIRFEYMSLLWYYHSGLNVEYLISVFSPLQKKMHSVALINVQSERCTDNVTTVTPSHFTLKFSVSVSNVSKHNKRLGCSQFEYLKFDFIGYSCSEIFDPIEYQIVFFYYFILILFNINGNKSCLGHHFV